MRRCRPPKSTPLLIRIGCWKRTGMPIRGREQTLRSAGWAKSPVTSVPHASCLLAILPTRLTVRIAPAWARRVHDVAHTERRFGARHLPTLPTIRADPACLPLAKRGACSIHRRRKA
jgi:hypothetical protein